MGKIKLFVGLTAFGWGMIISSNSQAGADFWVIICFLGGFFIPSAFLEFVGAFLGQEQKGFVRASYVLSVLFSALFFLGQTVSVEYKPALGFYWWAPKYLYHFYVAHLFAAASYGIYRLFRNWQTSYGIMKTKIMYVMSASALGFACGATAFVPAYFPIIPFGFYPFFLYPLVVAYAIVRYRLMDISLVIRKSLVYTLIIGLFTGIYISAIFLFSQLLQGMAVGFHPVLLLFLIILFAIAFQPLKTVFQIQIDRLFFQEKYNYQKTLKELSQASASLMDLNTLLKLVSKTIVDRVKVNSCSVYFLNKDKMAFTQKESYNRND